MSQHTADPGFTARCDALLAELVASGIGIRAATLSTADGRLVAANVETKEDKESSNKLAAMTAAMQALGVAVSREAGMGKLGNVIVEADMGRMVVMDVAEATPSLVLSTVSTMSANLGNVLWSSSRLRDQIVGVCK
jgi:predicted regulator of Ras-like GTPase activity (Roadblock/LC7/MglB family)